MVSNGRSERTTYIYKGKRISLKIVDTILPNGKFVKKEIVEHPGAVVILPILENDKVILLRQFRPSVKNWVYELPAGTLDKEGEDPKECALRELEEETGYRAEKVEALFKIYPSPGYCTEIIHVYVARGLGKTIPKREETEVIETLILSITDAIELIRKEDVADSKTLLALLYYEKYFRNIYP
ncbi:MAG: NUDIX hydrolase [Nitrososphaeria archaeon]|nr:NUDIX hydrolase [Nitrososphaeria archaeon]